MTYDTRTHTVQTHGGDWAGYEQQYGKEPLDFSMNVNPFGVPEGVAKAIASAALRADRYPDPGCRRIRRALADCEGVSEDWILCGNGAADLIDRIALGFAGGRSLALVTAPAFSEYREALERCGWDVRSQSIDYSNSFELTDADIEDIRNILKKGKPEGAGTYENRIIFLCEPNNPTGVTTNKKRLEEILKICRDTGTILVVDECFNGFLDDPEEHTLRNHLADNPGLIILKAFTKIYGMAGVRLGYCLCSDGEIIERIRNSGQPWNVSYLAEEAGLAALREKDYIERAREVIRTERALLKEELKKLGIRLMFGSANYILFRWPELSFGTAGLLNENDTPDLCEKMRSRGVLIRDCGNYEGLEKGWYRIAVKTPEENRELIRIMGEVMLR